MTSEIAADAELCWPRQDQAILLAADSAAKWHALEQRCFH